MRVVSEEINIKNLSFGSLENKLNSNVYSRPIRFVVTESTDNGYNCEIDYIYFNDLSECSFLGNKNSIFHFHGRGREKTNKFNAVLLIPTGIGAELGGHCGDGNALARLIGSSCDTLITHPNVVNAADMNEMTDNTLYVEGHTITRLLMGQIGLEKVRSNRMLLLHDKHEKELFNNEVVNIASSARVVLGIDCDVCTMEDIVDATSLYSKSGRCVGKIEQMEKLMGVIEKYINEYDAIALSTFVKVPEDLHKKYFIEDSDTVNPWGGIEAMITHSVSAIYDIPCAHAPMMTSSEVMNMDIGVVDPRKAPESSSVTYLYCVLKGLYKSPKITAYEKGLNAEDISCLIVPDGCIGLPVLACLKQKIPVIAVKNKNLMKNDLSKLPWNKNQLYIVDNYLEAIGVMNVIREGISLDSVTSPIEKTNRFTAS